MEEEDFDSLECWAVPGADSMIDTINSDGLTTCFGKDEATVKAQEPRAQRMLVKDFCAAKAARQRTPVEWRETTAEQYEEMLNVLPPAYFIGPWFLVGEPSDHDALSGEPRFQGYRYADVPVRYFTTSRPVTRREFEELRKR
jgi:hypothetical protein